MNISHLIAEIGDDNVELQMIDTSVIDIQAKPDYTRIAFAGPPADMRTLAIEGRMPKMGIVLWLDRDAVDAAMKRLT